jgi:hypothetical protein
MNKDKMNRESGEDRYPWLNFLVAQEELNEQKIPTY